MKVTIITTCETRSTTTKVLEIVHHEAFITAASELRIGDVDICKGIEGNLTKKWRDKMYTIEIREEPNTQYTRMRYISATICFLYNQNAHKKNIRENTIKQRISQVEKEIQLYNR
jgi:hypothetical protein